MRISWFSNAPWGSTGYANQTRVFAPRVKKLGHEIAITAFWGLEGAVLNWDGIPVYPKGHTAYGQDVLAAHAAHFQADIVLTLMDAWVCEPKMMGSARWVPWFPVDMDPLPQIIADKVRESYQPIVYSKFGEAAARQAGIETVMYVPHGVETQLFKPEDKAAAKRKAQIPTDKFVVGMVAANKGTPSRKSFPQCLQAFARLHKAHPDTVLYLHTSKGEGGEYQGVNLPELVRFLGIEDAVLYADAYTNLVGYPPSAMATLHNAFDVLLSPSMGEGFGIPILEAQACGTPVIVGDWTAMGELCFAGIAIPKEEAERYWTPLASYQYLPREGAVFDALERAYLGGLSSPEVREMARQGAMAYDADLVTEAYWKPALANIAARLEANSRLRLKLLTPGVA